MTRPGERRPLERWLRWAQHALAVGVVAAAWWSLDRGPPWAPLAAAELAAAPDCEPGWTREGGEPVDLDATTRLSSNAAVLGCVAAPGSLTVTLRGSVSAGIGSRAVLVQGSARLIDVELRGEERTFQVDVPTAGTLYLAFLNDHRADGEDRNLWISGIDFTPRQR